MALPENIGDKEVAKFVLDNNSETAVRTISQIANTLIDKEYDYIALTYVAAGNGEGEIETAIFKTGGAAGTTQYTLTLAYDANDRLSTVTRS